MLSGKRMEETVENKPTQPVKYSIRYQMKIQYSSLVTVRQPIAAIFNLKTDERPKDAGRGSDTEDEFIRRERQQTTSKERATCIQLLAYRPFQK
jgi:hypothetical protein